MRRLLLSGVALVALLAAPAQAAALPRPDWLSTPVHRALDGQADDLVTAGRGVGGLTGAAPAAPYADPARPTAAELRRAVLSGRRDAASGFGRLYGPNVTAGAEPVGDGRVAGDEYLAYATGDGRKAAVLLQVPRDFARERPCIVAIPVNGSSSLYRDITDFGFWGLQHGCAVVYTDKGAGNGVHDLEGDRVNTLDGTMAARAEAGEGAHFAAPLDDGARARLLAEAPHRLAFKHAHSRANAEAGWGRDVLRAIRFAFWQLNDRAGEERHSRVNTLVIVAGNSNGGGAALYAGEADAEGLIDGIVAGEPQVQTRPEPRAVVRYQGTERRDPGRTLLDYFTYGNLYQPCAVLALAEDAPSRAGLLDRAPARCASLRDKGLLTADTLPAQAAEALSRLHDYGYDRALDWLHAMNYAVVPDATAAKYVSAHGRFGVEDRVCGLSFAAVDAEGRPAAIPPAVLAQSFATAPGGAPFGPVDIINDRDPRGPRRNGLSISPSTGRADFNFDGALCLRDMATGEGAEARRVRAGIQEFLASGDLRGKPAIIVHGRLDDRVPAAFSSRPYLALNSLAEGVRSRLRYIEVENAEHFGFSGPVFDTRTVPLTPFLLRGLDAMWAHLTIGAPLPDSQVARTTPRGGVPGHAPPLTAANIPPVPARAAAADRITVADGHVSIPE